MNLHGILYFDDYMKKFFLTSIRKSIVRIEFGFSKNTLFDKDLLHTNVFYCNAFYLLLLTNEKHTQDGKSFMFRHRKQMFSVFFFKNYRRKNERQKSKKKKKRSNNIDNKKTRETIRK